MVSRWARAVWMRWFIASSMDLLEHYTNCSRSRDRGSEEVMKFLTSLSKHFITTEVRTNIR